MPDKKLTDAEIIKALECCAVYDPKLNECSKCPYDGECGTTKSNMPKDALDLINRLQDKNKNLQERNVILKGLVDTQKAENERLKKGWRADVILTADAKAEAYKEFWNSRPERLNEQCKGREEYNKGWNACLDEFWEIRNNLFYELVGNNNAL